MSALQPSPARKASRSDSFVSTLDAKPVLMPKPSKSVAMARATTTARRLRQVMGWIPRSEHAVRTKVQRHEDSFNPFALSLSKGRSFFAVRRRTVLRQRSEEHTSELQSLMRISYDAFCLKKKK